MRSVLRSRLVRPYGLACPGAHWPKFAGESLAFVLIKGSIRRVLGRSAARRLARVPERTGMGSHARRGKAAAGDGKQLERLHFTELSGASGPVVRRRVLGRLVRWEVLTTLERRIGGVRAGSSGLVYALNIAGKRLVTEDAESLGRACRGCATCATC